MAKKKKGAQNGTEEEGFFSKLVTFILVLLIILVWLAIFALMIKLDIGGLGTRLRPLIKDVPYLCKILPDVSDDVLIHENNYPYENISQAVNDVNYLTEQNKQLTDTNAAYAKKIADLELEVDRLKTFEEQQIEFAARVKRFDTKVVFNDKAPDIDEYKSFYEEISPENAAEIYRQVVDQLKYDEQIRARAKQYAADKPGNVAAAFENMADVRYVCMLLECMKIDEAAAIMNKFSTDYLSRVIQVMHDMDDEWAERLENNLLRLQEGRD